MASKIPVVRQVAWISAIPQLAVLSAMIYCVHMLGASQPLLIGPLSYLALSIGLRKTFARNQSKGMRYLKAGEYDKAISEFEKSYKFFSTYPWVDRYRYITLLSSTRISYREMSLVNSAFCYGQAGAGKKSKKLYEMALAEFPDSEIAKTCLRMFDSAQEIS